MQLEHVTREFGEDLRGIGRRQVAAFVPEQLAANALLERMQRPVDTHGAGVEQLGRAREVAGLHVSQEHFQLAEGDLLADPVRHCRHLHRCAA